MPSGLGPYHNDNNDSSRRFTHNRMWFLQESFKKTDKIVETQKERISASEGGG